jgi:hypothetical protein
LADADCGLEKMNPVGAGFGLWREQGGLVFVERIEQEAGAGFDNALQTQAIEKSRYFGDLMGKLGRGGVEGVVIERDSDTLKTQICQDAQGIFQAVVGKAVGVVPEEHDLAPGSIIDWGEHIQYGTGEPSGRKIQGWASIFWQFCRAESQGLAERAKTLG